MSSKSSKFCSHCGTTVKLDDVFCNNCGASLEDTIEPTVNLPVQPELYTQTTHTQHQTVYVPKPSSLNNVAIVALVLGIISVVVQFLPVVSFAASISGIIAIVTGAVSMQRTQKKYFALAGIILGVIGIVLWILSFVFGFRLYSFWW